MEVKSWKQERKDLKPEGRRMEMGRTPMWTELDQHSVFQDPTHPHTTCSHHKYRFLSVPPLPLSRFGEKTRA